MAQTHITTQNNPVKISPEIAGKLIGEPAQWVRVAMQQGRLPIGVCIYRKRYSYNIQLNLLAQYMGITPDECAGRLKEAEG